VPVAVLVVIASFACAATEPDLDGGDKPEVSRQQKLRKVRYRGITKNGAQVFSLLALANLYLARRRLKCACCVVPSFRVGFDDMSPFVHTLQMVEAIERASLCRRVEGK
jgi:hypothetical protein